jgi:hypothetical protein
MPLYCGNGLARGSSLPQSLEPKERLYRAGGIDQLTTQIEAVRQFQLRKYTTRKCGGRILRY